MLESYAGITNSPSKQTRTWNKDTATCHQLEEQGIKFRRGQLAMVARQKTSPHDCKASQTSPRRQPHGQGNIDIFFFQPTEKKTMDCRET
jgi:hypothetical protein